MADSAYFLQAAVRSTALPTVPKHLRVVRVTHWINALSFLGLLVSGIAILISHPRLYWGEAGSVGTPSLIDLPIPFLLLNQNGWGRYLHFLSAWVCVFNGLVYAITGIVIRHFRDNLLSSKASLEGKSSPNYNVPQKLTYLIVVFALFPAAIWTGLAMSPAIVSVFPALVEVFGGQQSARTIHFFVACFLVVFLLVHIAMVARAGFGANMRAMITGRSENRKAQET